MNFSIRSEYFRETVVSHDPSIFEWDSCYTFCGSQFPEGKCFNDSISKFGSSESKNLHWASICVSNLCKLECHPNTFSFLQIVGLMSKISNSTFQQNLVCTAIRYKIILYTNWSLVNWWMLAQFLCIHV